MVVRLRVQRYAAAHWLTHPELGAAAALPLSRLPPHTVIDTFRLGKRFALAPLFGSTEHPCVRANDLCLDDLLVLEPDPRLPSKRITTWETRMERRLKQLLHPTVESAFEAQQREETWADVRRQFGPDLAGFERFWQAHRGEAWPTVLRYTRTHFQRRRLSQGPYP